MHIEGNLLGIFSPMAAEQHIHNQSERLTTGLRFSFQMAFDFRLILMGGVGLINQAYRVRVDIVGMGWDEIESVRRVG